MTGYVADLSWKRGARAIEKFAGDFKHELLNRLMSTMAVNVLTFNNSTFRPHSVFMCFVWIWEKTTIIFLYSINL